MLCRSMDANSVGVTGCTTQDLVNFSTGLLTITKSSVFAAINCLARGTDCTNSGLSSMTIPWPLSALFIPGELLIPSFCTLFFRNFNFPPSIMSFLSLSNSSSSKGYHKMLWRQNAISHTNVLHNIVIWCHYYRCSKYTVHPGT